MADQAEQRLFDISSLPRFVSIGARKVEIATITREDITKLAMNYTHSMGAQNRALGVLLLRVLDIITEEVEKANGKQGKIHFL